ncbi:hypothetical protein PR048_024166 [Dryococelus australis]|uniref:YqaJ viral recombinase domain-containing protein n=1 Tax=Dryococelus australis TaxID=614101 RepID=A0ABQ9GW40_9NEOP|nr:hypothetical protein PR048_024166 [Dryococelus australis]
MLQIVGMHGLVYRRLIADGDSSVERKLIDDMPNGITRQVEQIEERTREQNSSHEWKVERSKRITSSFFEKICKMKATTSCANVVKEIRYQVFKGNSSTNWGIEKESVAIAQFERENPGIIVQRSGLIVDEEYPFLGASPDGRIGDDQIIEVK